MPRKRRAGRFLSLEFGIRRFLPGFSISGARKSEKRPAWRAHLDTPSKVRCKRAPVAELESSANPQPGKAALRSARFPACGFWRLSSRQLVVLSRCAQPELLAPSSFPESD